MSKTVNKHGVRITQVSTVHKSFSKTSRIPADDITPAVLADWERQRVEAACKHFSLIGNLFIKDVPYSGSWLTAKLRALRDANGERVLDDTAIKSITFTHGRMCFSNNKRCWEFAAKLYDAAVEQKSQ